MDSNFFISKLFKRKMLRKVPEITVYFWIVKLLTTAMGEAVSDYLTHQFNPIFAVAFGGILLLLAFILQFSVHKYIPYVYWVTVTMVAIFGTMAADVLHAVTGIPYIFTTIFFLIALLSIFRFWYMREKNLSIHSIYTHQREIFYWLTVIATFALGTAAGDMTATTFGLGYFASAILFGMLIGLVALAYFIHGLGEILAFWLVYILTRPLGASLADWLGKPQTTGGVGIGAGEVSIILLLCIIIAVTYLTVQKKKLKGDDIG